MIPKKLTIKGIYSYQEKQVINFDNLVNAELFGIFGAVGSGKSTILEAISFAIYGETERLNSKDKRWYNMMNLKSNEMYIEFEFINNENHLYKMIFTSKRNKKDFTDVPKNVFAAYQWINQDWQAIEYDPEKDAEKITGLNYDNFKRTVVIPQGRFQEFMLLKPAERNTMLKELFNLQRYDIADNFVMLWNSNKSKIDTITGQLQSIGDVSEEGIQLLEKENMQLKNEYQNLQQDINKQQQQLNLFEQQAKAAIQFKNKQQELQQLQQQESEIEQLKIQTENYEKLFFLVKSDLDHYQQLTNTIEATKKKISKTTQDLQLAKGDFEKIQHEFNIIKKEYENKEQIIFTNEALKKILDIKQKSAEAENLKSRIEKGNEKLIEINKKITACQKTILNKNAALLQLKNQLPDVAKLSKIKEWWTTANMLQALKKEIQIKILQVEKNISQKNTAIEKIFEEYEFTEFIPIAGNKDMLQQKIIEKINAAEQKIKLQEPQLLQLQIQQELAAYAKALKHGEPCPLCGSKEHPSKLEITENKKVFKQLEKEKETQQRLIEELYKVEKNYLTLHAAIEQWHDQHQTLQKETTEIDSKITLHQQQFIWAEEKTLTFEQITESIEKYEHLQKQIKISEQEISTLTNDIEKENKNKEKFSEALQDFQQQLAGITSNINLLQNQIDAHLFAKYTNFNEKQINSAIADNSKKLEYLQQQYVEKEAALQKLHNSVQSFTAGLTHLNEQFSEAMQQSEMLQKAIENKLLQNTKFTIKEAQIILSTDINLNEIKNTIQQYEEQSNSLKQQLDELAKELEKAPYNLELHETLLQQFKQQQEKIKTLLLQIGQNEAQIAEGKQKMETAKSLQGELELLSIRQHDINTLKNLFRSAAFTNYIATMHMQNLCRNANKRFYQLTRHQLGLELSDDNTFVIRDYMNDGHLRNIKTLSGGQTFQASLCLALALADNNQQLSKSEKNFFFLDEGFGTLDKESLQIVFETLQTLRNENRIVGLISHVEEMQQEINTYLYVTNNIEKGSTIKASWE